MIEQFIKGLAMGIGAAAPIGPVNIEIARRTLTRGFLAGFSLGCGAVTVDVAYAILTSLGMKALGEDSPLYAPLQVAGGCVLAFLGVRAWKSAISAARSDALEAEPPISTLKGGYLTGLLMTLFNPMTLIFWFSTVVSARGPHQQPGDLPIICTGVFVATLTWVAFFAGTLKWLREWRRHWGTRGWMIAADALGGSMLLGFAGFAFWTSLRRFL